MTTNDIAKMGDGGRQGCYDVDVEIFRRGSMMTGYLSHVLPGDCFQKIVNGEPTGRWFKCLSPIVKSYLHWDRHNPTFILEGVEVMQAAPKIVRSARALPEPAAKPDDVEDVDFQDKE